MAKENEGYEYSPLFLFIKELYLPTGGKYKKIDNKIICDMDLTTNDLAVYLSIVKNASYVEDYFQSISHRKIAEVCGISQSNQARSIHKLESKDYIKLKHFEGLSNSYQIEINPKNYIPLKMEQFDGLNNKKKYIRILRGLILSNGNNQIPTYRTAKNNCTGTLIREEYNKIKEIYYHHKDNERDDIDISNYLSLIST